MKLATAASFSAPSKSSSNYFFSLQLLPHDVHGCMHACVIGSYNYCRAAAAAAIAAFVTFPPSTSAKAARAIIGGAWRRTERLNWPLPPVHCGLYNCVLYDASASWWRATILSSSWLSAPPTTNHHLSPFSFLCFFFNLTSNNRSKILHTPKNNHLFFLKVYNDEKKTSTQSVFHYIHHTHQYSYYKQLMLKIMKDYQPYLRTNRLFVVWNIWKTTNHI